MINFILRDIILRINEVGPTPLAFEDLDLDTVVSIAFLRVDLVCFDFFVNEKDERQLFPVVVAGERC